jgi:hypothetical protein
MGPHKYHNPRDTDVSFHDIKQYHSLGNQQKYLESDNGCTYVSHTQNNTSQHVHIALPCSLGTCCTIGCHNTQACTIKETHSSWSPQCAHNKTDLYSCNILHDDEMGHMSASQHILLCCTDIL